MGQLDQILSFPGLTLAGIAESFLAIKLFPEYYSSQSHLSTVAVILLCNYAFGILFWFLLYPFFFSPLRNLKGPRVSDPLESSRPTNCSSILQAFISPAHKSLLVTDRPAGDLWLDLIKQYPGEELLGLTFRRNGAAITHPRLLADVLVHRSYDFAKPPKVRNFLRHVLGDGLIIVEGDQHKFLRKNTMPAFHFRHIKELYPMIVSKADLLTNALKKEIASSQGADEKGSGSGVIELSTWASKVTIDIIGIAGLGRKFNVVEKNSDPLQELYEELLEPSREKLTFAISCFVLGYDFVKHIPWKMNDLFQHLTGSLDKICFDMIREKRDAITKKGDDHFDVLSLLIKSDNFSDSELKDQLLTFLAAG
jgi:cytochrome P450